VEPQVVPLLEVGAAAMTDWPLPDSNLRELEIEDRDTWTTIRVALSSPLELATDKIPSKMSLLTLMVILREAFTLFTTIPEVD
jgi:hypothetical protein